MMLDNIGENKVSVKQNSAGMWRGEITITCISVTDGIALMSKAIDQLSKILESKNNEKDEKKQ